MKKDKISIFYSGYSFHMSFYNEEGKKIENFIMNDNYTIRKDPFFYHGNGSLCFEYLKELEAKYSK